MRQFKGLALELEWSRDAARNPLYSIYIWKKYIKTVLLAIDGKTIECIRFADDTAVLAESGRTLTNTINDLNKSCKNLERGLAKGKQNV